MSNVTAWRRTLDGLRADLDIAEACVATDDFVALPAFRPPDDLGPLPAAFADEARELSRRHDAIVADLSARPEPRARTAAQRPAARTVPRFEARA